MAEQVTDPPAGGTVIDLGKRVKAKYPEYANLSDEEVGRKVKAKYPDAYGGFADTPSFPQAPTPMTTPLPGAAAGPSISSAGSLAAPQEPSPQQQIPPPAATPQAAPGLPESVQPIRLDEAGDEVVEMPAEFLTKSRQQEAWKTALNAPDKQTRDAAHAQIKADRDVRAKMDRVFAQKQEDRRLVDQQASRDLQFSLAPQEVPTGLPEGQGPATTLIDPRDQKVRADYLKSLTPEEQAYRASKKEAGAWVDRDAFDEDVSSLAHAMNVLDARERRLLRKSEFRKAQQQTDALGDVLHQDNEDIMAEAKDIDLGRQYVIDRLKTAVQRHPEYATEEIARKAKTIEADANSIGNPLMYNVAQPIRFAIDKFASSLLTTPRTFGGSEYGLTDQLADFAEKSMENIRADEPTAFRGNILEDGKVHPERILPKVVETIGQAGLLVGTSPTSPALLASAFVQSNGDYYKQATEAGLTHGQAQKFAWGAAALNSALELASPNDAARQAVSGALRKEIASGLEQKLTTKEILSRASKMAVKEALPEMAQEGGQYLGDKGAAYLANRILGSDNLDDNVKFSEFTENSLLGGVVGGLAGGAPEAMRLASISETAKNPQKVAQAAAAMGDEQAKEKVQRIVNTYNGNGLHSAPPEKAAVAADAIIRKNDIEQSIKGAPMDPALEAAIGDPRKRQAAELTTAVIEAMGIPATKAKAALVGAGMEKAPEGTKVVTNPDGSVTLEKKPEAGEKKKPTGAPTGVPEGGGAVTPIAPSEPTTNEERTTPQAPAAAQTENTGTAPGVPLEQPTSAEPVANSIDRHETRNKQYIVERGEDGQVRVTQAPGYKPRPLPPMPDADAPSAVIRQWKREKNKVDDAERQARRTALIEYEKEYGVDTGRGHKTPIQKWNESVADVNGRMNKMSDQNKDPRLYALSFLLNGGKINFAAAKKELGSNARTDLDKLKKNGILVDDPNAKSVQGVADALAESMAEQLGTDVGTAAELRTALIDALGHNSRSGVLKAMTDILDKMPKVKDAAGADPMARMTPEDWDDVNAVQEARDAFIEYVQKTGGDVDLANAWFDDEVGKNQSTSFDHETPERQQQLIETAEQALSQLPPDGTEAETGTPDAAPGETDAGTDAGGVGKTPSRQSDAEEQRLAAEAKRARAERDRFVADWNERGQGLFAPEEGMAQQTIDGGFDNSQENFDARVEPLNERVRQADKALADYVNSAASRAQAAAQQTSIDQAAADNIPVSKPEKAMSSASRFRPRKRVEFDTPIKGPSGAVLKAYEWQYEFEEYIDDRGEERVRRVSDWNKAELSDETGRDIVHQFEVVTPDGLGYLVSAESALKLMGYMEANASVKSKMSAAKALAGLLMQRQVLQEEVARRKAVEDEVDALKRPEITEEDKSENEELRGFGREESKNRINQIWRMGDASIWASFKKDDPFLNSEKEERTKTLVRSWKDNRLKERGVKSYENPSAKLREVEKKIATKERQLGAKATDVTQAPAQAEAPLPKKEETTYEAKARKAAAILERAKLKPDQLYALPLPPSVWNGAIRAMQEVIIAGGKAADAIAAAIKHIQASDWWKNKATQKEKDEIMSHLQGRISDLETALAAEDVASLKENIQQAKATGAQNVRTKQQDARKEFMQTVKDALKPLHGRMTPAQVKFITAAAAKVNPASPKSVSRFERVAAKAMAKANYADDLSKAKQAQKRAKKLAKQADVPLNHREALKAIAKVDVGMLNDPAEFTGPVLDYLQQFGAIGKSYQPGSSEAIIDAMGKLQEQTMAEYRNMLLEEFGVEAGSVDPQQLYDALESDDFDAFAKNLEESKRKEVADAIRQVADYSKMGLESYENDDLSATEKKTLDTLRSIDIDLLSTDQQKDYIKTADNITLNDAFYGAGRMEAVAKATEGLAAAEKAVKSTPLRKVWTTPLKEMYQQQFASVSGMFRFLFGQGEGMAKFHDAIGMTDLILGKKKVDDAVSNAGEKMADFYTGLRKKYKDADTDTMRAAEGIAAYVLQPIPNIGLEESFALRKQQVADSIAAKSERTKRQDEAEVEQRAFDLVLNEATTRDELIRAMKAKAPSAWASVEFLANQVLAPHSKEVLEHRENFWNEAVDVDNPMYLPISYRFLTSAQIAEDAPGQFGAAEKLRKPKESANLIKRESVKTLPKDRVIDMNIRRNTLNALERNLYDTYTSPAWQRMREFFRLPAASKVVGGLDNSDFMQSRLNDLRSAQMREGSKADNLERAVSAITNTVRKAASQIALGGFTQAIKQPADQLTSAMVNVGPEWVGKSIMEVNKAEPLLQLTSIGDRGELIGGTNWDNTLEAETAAMARALKGNKMERFEAATESYRRLLMAALTKSDVLSARTAWLAYYQKYLADKGIEVSNWQQEADMVKEGDPVRRQALAFAEVNADITQGSSDPTKQAKLGQRSPQAWANLLKAAFNPFSSFTIGMRERIINDASDLMFYGGRQMYDTDGKRTKEGDRAATAGRSLAATLASNIMFTVAKVYIAKSLIALGAEGIRAAFAAAAGDDDDDKQKGMAMMSLMMNILYTMRLMDADVYRMFSTAYRDEKKESKMSESKKLDAEQEKALRNAKNAYTSIMQSMLVSGFSPFAENALVDGVNWGSYMMQGAMGELPTTKSTGAPMKYDYWVKQPEYPPLYRYGQGYHESNYGVFSVILDRASELQEQAKDAAGFGKASGPSVESPDDAKKRIEAMAKAAAQ